MALHTFSPNTVILSADVMADLSGLADGSNDTTANSLRTTRNESQYPYAASGLVITADSAGVNKNASMTAGVIYINGRRLSISLVTARVYTASKDTYVDVLDNLDGTGTLVYTEVANNAASPALASNSARIAIVVAGATFIAAAASINQGQTDRVLPIASSIAYTVTDSLGNLICNRNPTPDVIGYRQVVASQTTVTVSAFVDCTGLSVPFIVPTGRKIKVSVFSRRLSSTGASSLHLAIYEGGTQLTEAVASGTASGNVFLAPEYVTVPSAGLHTYKAAFEQEAAGTLTFDAGATLPSFILVELI